MTMIQPALSLQTARQHVALKSLGGLRDDITSREVPGGIGLEPEYFVVRYAALGTPEGRPSLATILDWLNAAAEASSAFRSTDGGTKGAPRYDLACGGQLTFEPGGQV